MPSFTRLWYPVVSPSVRQPVLRYTCRRYYCSFAGGRVDGQEFYCIATNMVALSRVENQKLEQEHALHRGYYMAGGDTKFLFKG